MAKTGQVSTLVNAEVKDAIARAATARGMKSSAWLRMLAGAELERVGEMPVTVPDTAVTALPAAVRARVKVAASHAKLTPQAWLESLIAWALERDRESAGAVQAVAEAREARIPQLPRAKHGPPPKPPGTSIRLTPWVSLDAWRASRLDGAVSRTAWVEHALLEEMRRQKVRRTLAEIRGSRGFSPPKLEDGGKVTDE